MSSDGDTRRRKPPVAGGPRLGKLQGLGGSRDDGDDLQMKRRGGTKNGIKILPLILMFVVFGPAVLPAFIWLYDKVAASEWGLKLGLSTAPRDRLVQFYKKHNPTKLGEVDHLMRKYKGRYEEMFRKLEAKYEMLEEIREARKKDDEYYATQAEREEPPQGFDED